MCSPHVSGPSDRLRPSLRPFARRCCVCQALASCGNFIGHRNAASANPAHLQTRNPAYYPRVTCSTPSTGPDCISYCCTYRCARRTQIQPIPTPGAHCLWIPAYSAVQQTSLAYHPNSARTRTTASIPSYCITRSYGTLAGLPALQ